MFAASQMNKALCIVLYCTVLHCTALHCIALHCIVDYLMLVFTIVNIKQHLGK